MTKSGKSQYKGIRSFYHYNKYDAAPRVNIHGRKARQLTSTEIREWLQTIRRIEDRKLGKKPSIPPMRRAIV